MPAKKVYWLGTVSKCDGCGGEFDGTMYDMKTKLGPWGCLCHQCAYLGPGIGQLGTGRGQKYKKQEDGRWLKVEG